MIFSAKRDHFLNDLFDSPSGERFAIECLLSHTLLLCDKAFSYSIHSVSYFEADLPLVRKNLNLGAPFELVDRLLLGQRILNRSGPLAATVGTMIREASFDRFVSSVDGIPQGIVVTLVRQKIDS